MSKRHKNFRQRKRKLLTLLGSLATDNPQYFGHAYTTLSKELNNAESPSERIARERAEERERQEELAYQQRWERLHRNRFARGAEVTAQKQKESGGASTGSPLSSDYRDGVSGKPE